MKITLRESSTDRNGTRHVHSVALDDSHKGTLLMWRLLSIALAVIMSVTMHNLEASGLLALFGEHLGEVVEYVGEWFGRL
jgi:hypothetical protein